MRNPKVCGSRKLLMSFDFSNLLKEPKLQLVPIVLTILLYTSIPV